MSDGRDSRAGAPFPIAEAMSVPDPKVEESPGGPPSEDVPGSGQLKLVTVINASLPDLENSQVTRVPAEKSKKKDPYLGATIDGRYKVESQLGEGGMGVVYRCVHTIIGKKVAMKVLRADLARDKEVTERFLNEAKSASAIGNPHIIDISDFGLLPDGSAYFVMEYLEGIPLTKIVEGGKPVPVPRIIEIARQLGEGLAAAHKAGIVHRDLKPDNIYLVERGSDERLRQDPRLRHRQGQHPHRGQAHARRRGVRHATLHVPGAGGGHPRRSSRRHLFFRRDPVRDGERQGPVRRRQLHGDLDPAHVQGADRDQRARAPAPGRAPRARSDRPEVPLEAPRAALCRRWKSWSRTWRS